MRVRRWDLGRAALASGGRPPYTNEAPPPPGRRPRRGCLPSDPHTVSGEAPPSRRASAPPDSPTDFDKLSAGERDRAWFFKLFSLRGMVEGEERMCFFTYLQKSEDTFDSDS